jgi:hypothetical protein
VCAGSTPVTRITAKERRQIDKRSKRRQAQLRKRYPEVHGKVVDFITHTIDDGTLYFTVRFKDKTSFCLRYACDMFVVGADLSDWRSGDFHVIREYIKPMRR